jgi:aspartate carbamoyltransferase catalytic subunit|tara:strand:+ start:772 stop:1674 length:903 start_codon:yes stop_codon:yes gene_type:complete
MAKYQHLIDTTKLDRDWVEGELFSLCDKIRIQSDFEPAMKGRSLYCLFYEPSFLTRTSFEQAAGLMDGQAFHTEDASQFFPVHTPNYIDNIINILASLHINLVILRSGDPGVVERAASAEAMPVVNGGSPDDHPTQALADLYTIHNELGGVDGKTIAVVGRLEHRNVSALLKGLAMFDGIKLMLVPFSGQVPEEVMSHCEENGVTLQEHRDVDSLSEADAIYLNGPRTVAHAQLLRSRGSGHLKIDDEFMSRLKDNCIVMDPMQRSGDFSIETQDARLAFYRQAENALFVRMAVIRHVLG